MRPLTETERGRTAEMKELVVRAGKYISVGILFIACLPVLLPLLFFLSFFGFVVVLPLGCTLAIFLSFRKYVGMLYKKLPIPSLYAGCSAWRRRGQRLPPVAATQFIDLPPNDLQAIETFESVDTEFDAVIVSTAHQGARDDPAITPGWGAAFISETAPDDGSERGEINDVQSAEDGSEREEEDAYTSAEDRTTLPRLQDDGTLGEEGEDDTAAEDKIRTKELPEDMSNGSQREGTDEGISAEDESGKGGIDHDVFVEDKSSKGGTDEDISAEDERTKEGLDGSISAEGEILKEGVFEDRSPDDEITEEGVFENISPEDEITEREMLENVSPEDESTNEGVFENISPEDEITKEGVFENISPEDEIAEEGGFENVFAENDNTKEGVYENEFPGIVIDGNENTKEGIDGRISAEGAISKDGVFVDRSPEDEITKEGGIENGSPEDEISKEGVIENGSPEDELAEEGVVENVSPEDEISKEGVVENVSPEDEITKEGLFKDSTPDDERERDGIVGLASVEDGSRKQGLIGVTPNGERNGIDELISVDGKTGHDATEYDPSVENETVGELNSNEGVLQNVDSLKQLPNDEEQAQEQGDEAEHPKPEQEDDFYPLASAPNSNKYVEPLDDVRRTLPFTELKETEVQAQPDATDYPELAIPIAMRPELDEGDQENKSVSSITPTEIPLDTSYPSTSEEETPMQPEGFSHLLLHQASADDIWICKECGWKYPNARPSAKIRRNHKKHCTGHPKADPSAEQFGGGEIERTSTAESIGEGGNFTTFAKDDYSNGLGLQHESNEVAFYNDEGISKAHFGGHDEDSSGVEGSESFRSVTNELPSYASESFRSAPDDFADDRWSSLPSVDSHDNEEQDQLAQAQEELQLSDAVNAVKEIVGDMQPPTGSLLTDMDKLSEFLGIDLPTRSTDVPDIEWAKLAMEVIQVVVGID